MKGKLYLILAIFLVFIIALSGCGGGGGGDDTNPPINNGTDKTAPSIPTNLTATPVSDSQIDLSWNESTDNVAVAGYKIYRDGTYLKSVTDTSTSDTGLSISLEYCYVVSAYDEAQNESKQSPEVYTAVLNINEHPTVEIISPLNNQTFTQGNVITFEGNGYDPEDGVLCGDSLVWSSSIGGQIGTGLLLTSSGLGAGEHTITLTATDYGGAKGSCSVNINVRGLITWYKDTDGDKYSDGSSQISVERPSNDYYQASELVATSGDCDDTNNSICPGETDICGDGIDQDCSGSDFVCFTIKTGNWHGSQTEGDHAFIYFGVNSNIELYLNELSTNCSTYEPMDPYTITNYKFSIHKNGGFGDSAYGYFVSGTFINETTCVGVLEVYVRGLICCQSSWRATASQ